MRTLRVSQARPIAEGIHRFELRDPAGAPLPPFTAGAHVQVKTPSGMLRKYSLCNDPAETDRYVFAVKRESIGRGGSADLIDHVRAGDSLEVSAPENAFELNEKAAAYLFIAGGIGITPILSMVWRAAALGKPFRLYYCTRSPADTAFGEELAAFAPNVTIHHDGGDPDRALDLWPLLEKPTREHVYVCGPRPMLEAARDMTGHWSRPAIHFESFLEAAGVAKPEDAPFEIVLAQSGTRLEVPAGKSILEVMRAHGHDAPSSCEAGTCGTCKTRLLEGVADHRDLVLDDAERGGHIMICVSRARTRELVIDR
jgi:phthalate 4,5-dioxygenase reductase component